MVRLKAGALPQATLEKQVSIPYGSIKSKKYNNQDKFIWLVSIPYGSIKSWGGCGG